MPAVHANLGPFAFHGGSFRPQGKVVSHGPTTNAPNLSGRIVVGLNVGEEPRYTLADVVSVFLERVAPPGVSFLTQPGIYTHRSGSHAGKIVEEGSVQILILDADNRTLSAFTTDMTLIAESVVRELGQEEVILDVQQRGLSVDVFRVYL